VVAVVWSASTFALKGRVRLASIVPDTEAITGKLTKQRQPRRQLKNVNLFLRSLLNALDCGFLDCLNVLPICQTENFAKLKVRRYLMEIKTMMRTAVMEFMTFSNAFEAITQ
jgi:hypothetical protein